MKIYRKGATIVIDRGLTKKEYIPTLAGRFYFEDGVTVLVDIYTKLPLFFETATLQNEAGSVIGNEAAVETYLAAFVGQSFNTSVTDSIDTVEQNLSDHEANVTDAHDLVNRLAAKQASLGFTAENSANKSTTLSADQASDIKYPSVKSVYDWTVSIFATIANLALKAPIASPTFTGVVTVPNTQNNGYTIAQMEALSVSSGFRLWNSDLLDFFTYNGSKWIGENHYPMTNNSGADVTIGYTLQPSLVTAMSVTHLDGTVSANKFIGTAGNTAVNTAIVYVKGLKIHSCIASQLTVLGNFAYPSSVTNGRVFSSATGTDDVMGLIVSIGAVAGDTTIVAEHLSEIF